MSVSPFTLIKQSFIEFVNLGKYLPEVGNALLALFPVGSLLTVFVKTVFNVIQWGEVTVGFSGDTVRVCSWETSCVYFDLRG